MSIKDNIIGEALDVFQEETEKGLATAKQQVTGNQPVAKQQQSTSSNQSQQPSDASLKPQLPDAAELKQANDQANEDLVKSMYAPTETLPVDENKQKEEALKQKFHGDYYEQLVNPPKPQEERPQEKVEREDEEKKEVELQEEEKKKEKEELPLIVTKGMGTAEKLKGVSG